MLMEIVDDPTAQRIIDSVKEAIRVRRLSDIELIRECIQSEISDDPKVVELMDRVLPNYLDLL